MAIEKPTASEIRAYSDRLGFDLTDSEIETYREIVDGNLESYRVLDSYEDDVLTPRYPRSGAHHVADDPHNAWALGMTVAGAGSGLLAGRTVVVKDNMCLAGAPVPNGSGTQRGYVAQSDATVVTRVLDAGATIIGKANCEYLSASGGSHTSATGPVLNPHRLTHSAGGSSSGCAVLVATGQADLAIGTDQGGSVRMPASFTGVVGMKPTHGLVPYTGITPIDPTMDHVGPMTRTVTDNALLLTVLAGSDGLDPRQYAPLVGDYLERIDDGLAGLRVGIVTEGFRTPASDPSVDAAVRAAALELRELGAEVDEVSIPEHAESASVWSPITAEGALRTICYDNGLAAAGRGFYPIDLFDQLARWRESAAAMPANAKLVLLTAEHMRSQHRGRYYLKAHNRLRAIRAAYDAALSSHDLLVMPTTPMTATPLPPRDASIDLVIQRAFEPLANTAVFDATGHPALSLPCAVEDGLPVGLMLVGRHHDEATIYRAARALEKHLALDVTPSG